jgi:hypothetical protein
VIRSVGRAQTPDAQSLSQALAAAQPGQQVSVTVTRGAAGGAQGSGAASAHDLTVRVALDELPGS